MYLANRSISQAGNVRPGHVWDPTQGRLAWPLAPHSAGSGESQGASELGSDRIRTALQWASLTTRWKRCLHYSGVIFVPIQKACLTHEWNSLTLFSFPHNGSLGRATGTLNKTFWRFIQDIINSHSTKVTFGRKSIFSSKFSWYGFCVYSSN